MSTRLPNPPPDKAGAPPSLAAHLPASLAATLTGQWASLATLIADWQRAAARPLLIGLSGAQGSGKSTLAAHLVQQLTTRHGLHAATVSLDDFYLTRAQRQQLASTIHPLFVTRGPPGTHDLPLMDKTLAALRQPGPDSSTGTAIPRFEKPSDDRAPAASWPRVHVPLDVVILEGWCLGARPQDPADLIAPLNQLEAEEDPHLVWRQHINQQLATSYVRLWTSLDKLLLLQAPSWSAICTWRAEAEARLPGGPAMTLAQLSRFMQHYERTARTLLATPPAADMVWCLDAQRRVT